MLTRTSTITTLAIVVAFVSTSALTAAERVFTYKQAAKARRLARDECKPLVIHFVPDDRLGGEQIESYYQGHARVLDSILKKVVIIAVPTNRFPRFAQQLGITGPGGYRTISAYDLDVVDEVSFCTVRTGFV